MNVWKKINCLKKLKLFQQLKVTFWQKSEKMCSSSNIKKMIIGIKVIFSEF